MKNKKNTTKKKHVGKNGFESSEQFFTSLIYDIFVFLTKAKGKFYIRTSSLVFLDIIFYIS